MKVVLLVFSMLLATIGLGADESFIPVAGSVGVFRTDMRIVNPSGEEEIVIQATYHPRPQANLQPVSKQVTIPPRAMVVYDDVVASLFESTDLGAIRLVSDDSFGATARIYAQEQAGTLGQFIVGVPLASAMEKGILLQLKSSATFRTNVGMVNPSGTIPAEVKLYLYDAANSVVANATVTLQPFQVMAPANVTGLLPTSGANLSDAWISYESDIPVIVYGSVIDNRTTDPTYVPAIVDTGSIPPQQEQTRTFEITAFQWGYAIRENGQVINSINVAKGTRVVMRFATEDVEHGFNLSPYVSVIIRPGSVQEAEWVADEEGTFEFFCTVASCGSGHPNMIGSLTVGAGGSPGPPGYAKTTPAESSKAGSEDHSHHHH